MLAAGRAEYAGWAREASRATVRATFYEGSAVFESNGRVVAGVTGEAGWALANVGGEEAVAADSLTVAPGRFWFGGVPVQFDRLEKILKNKSNQS